MNVGERVQITGQAGTTTMMILNITGLSGAEQYTTDKDFMRQVCTFAYHIFGADTKVVWLAREENSYITPNLVDGFPVFLTPENEMIGLDGEKLSFQFRDSSSESGPLKSS